MKKRKRRVGRVLIAICIVAVIAGWMLWHRKDAKQETQTQNQAMRVTVITPSINNVARSVHVTGQSVAREELLVQSELANLRITHIYADVGDHVKRGARLASLDDAGLKTALQQARSDMQKAADEFYRYVSIADTGAVSAQSVTEKRTTYQAAKARLEDAVLNNKRATITAPRSGIITERRATIGEIVSASTPMFRIAQNGKVEAELRVPEAMLTQVRKRQQVNITISGNQTPIQGMVRLVTPRIDATNRTAMVRVALPSATALPVGLFVNATIITGNVEGMLIPASTLQRDASGTYVWQVNKESRVQRLPVELLMQQEETVIIKPIAPDAQLIAKAGTFVKEGELVSVISPQVAP